MKDFIVYDNDSDIIHEEGEGREIARNKIEQTRRQLNLRFEMNDADLLFFQARNCKAKILTPRSSDILEST